MRYLIPDDKRLIISNSEYADVVTKGEDVVIVINDCFLESIEGDAKYNDKPIQEEVTLYPGDELSSNDARITYHKDYIDIEGDYETSLQATPQDNTRFEDYPVYSKSPRIIKNCPEDTIDISDPPSLFDREKGGILRRIIPPLVTIAGTIVVGVTLGRGIYMYVMALSAVVATSFSVSDYITSKRERKKKEKLRISKYDSYLLSIRERLSELRQKQIEAMTYQAPTVNEILQMLKNNSDRLYERSVLDGDFFSFRMATSDTEATFKPKLHASGVELSEDPLITEMRSMVSRFTTIKDMPYSLSLNDSHLALIGEKKFVIPVLCNILTQLSFFISYHDLEFVIVPGKDSKTTFNILRHMPHTKISSLNMTGILSEDNIREQLLGSMTRILKERKEKIDSKSDEVLFLPYYVFVIEDYKSVINHPIMEYLQGDSTRLGIRIIFLSELESSVPENIDTTVIIKSSTNATVRIINKRLVNKEINLDTVSFSDCEMVSRLEAPIIHNKGIKSNIPESCGFLELYGVRKPRELNIATRWAINDCSKTLAVPVGLRTQNDTVYLNLHEKAHGPHGLIAGTTGSGKSELVQTYILSLALNFSPLEVGFLLIDYKGGGMANLFEGLPHVMGTITNLDKTEAIRSLLSIKAENRRRQAIFNEAGVNNINQYSKMYRKGVVSEPLPHLFIVCDEFAELKKEQPDFMSELVSTSRIGRSLGVHLILATQKPTGIVDDQIWSNSSFKIALKVQTESDSKELIKTTDAAFITNPGRAYLQVGNNEVYELFQSAYSGAPYREIDEKEDYDHRVYIVRANGQGELISEDLSDDSDKFNTNKSQLEVVVDEIRREYDRVAFPKIRRIWFESLSSEIVSPIIMNDIEAESAIDLRIPIGLMDIPDEQKQEVYFHDFANDGSLAIIGGVQCGKSTILMNIALSIAKQNTCDACYMYILDYGNSSLVGLNKLPHVADYISVDDEEKRIKLLNILNDEIRSRKLLLKESGLNDIAIYNKRQEDERNRLPYIVVLLDNYEGYKDLGAPYDALLGSIIRSGTGLGISLVVSVGSLFAIKASIATSLQNRILLYTDQSSDLLSCLGRPANPFEIPNVPGRCAVKCEGNIHLMQAYAPVSISSGEEYLDEIDKLIEGYINNNSSPIPSRIPLLPERLIMDEEETSRIMKHIPKDKITLGLNSEKVVDELIDIKGVKLVISIKNICDIIMNQSEGRFNYVYCDIIGKDPEALIEEIERLLVSEENEPKPVVVFIPDGEMFGKKLPEDMATRFSKLMDEIILLGGGIFAEISMASTLLGGDPISKKLRSEPEVLVLGVPQGSAFIKITDPEVKNHKLRPSEGYLKKDNSITRVFFYS